ncbi:uncharacterized protein LOC110687067 [Chenopodium quinoa]|uniref:uncharacterized protein LOC110687067 n=1 Tax=Chenopodium quinoa TaxID=63459 RepID=UPI000B77E82F|nr:uncharacterized protein LOC110687067 [Chenopodium quinoa]
MNILKPCKYSYHNNHHSSFHSISSNFAFKTIKKVKFYSRPNVNKLCTVRASYAGGEARNNEDVTERKSFLSLEEAGLVEISGLSVHERFLCRLTISSLNLLRVIAEQEGCSIEELNAGRICDWFLKDKLKREQNIGSAVLQWDDDDPFAGQF